MALGAALDTLRRHPDQARLGAAAVRRAAVALSRACRDRSLVLRLQRGRVLVDGDPLLSYQPQQAPFGVLRAVGIGEIELQCGIDLEQCSEFVLRIATVPGGATGGEFPPMLASQLPDVRFVASPEEGPALPLEADWTGLPTVGPASADLRLLVERDLAANLPMLVAQRLLDDCALTGAAPGPTLPRLLRRALDAGDIPTAAWILTATTNQQHVPAAAIAELTTMAERHCSEEWLAREFATATRSELLDLSVLVLQLGHPTVGRFVTAAAGHALEPWLCHLVGHHC
jgi:hypothetical protein